MHGIDRHVKKKAKHKHMRHCPFIESDALRCQTNKQTNTQINKSNLRGQPLQIIPTVQYSTLGKLFAFDPVQAFTGITDLGTDLNLHIISDLCTACDQPPFLLSEQIPSAGFWAVGLAPGGILERGEFFGTVDFEYTKTLGEWEDVKDEKLEFHAVGLGRLDEFASGKIDGGNLLSRNVERHVLLHLFHRLEEGGGIKVVCNVGSTESELTVCSPLLGLFLAELRVLHHGKGVTLGSEDTYALCGDGLAHNLGTGRGVAR